MAINEKVILVPGSDTKVSDCISCCEPTLNISMCCKAAICRACYQKWLASKRTCMHCNRDQTTFDIWYKEFRQEPEYDPHDFISRLRELFSTGEIPMSQVNFAPPQNFDDLFGLLEERDLQDFNIEFGFSLPNGQTWQHTIDLSVGEDSSQISQGVQSLLAEYADLVQFSNFT